MNISELLLELDQDLKDILKINDLLNIKSKWIGKSGKIKDFFSELAKLQGEEKISFAKQINELKEKLEIAIRNKQEQLEQLEIKQKLNSEFVDLSYQRSDKEVGSFHPIRLTEDILSKVMSKFGFKIVNGSSLETEYYCFDALNIPKHHPARDMQDTFFTSNGYVLRTHTTAITARELHKGKLPIKIITKGRVYRNEKEDASHQAMFHQFDAVWIEDGIALPQLQAILTHLLKSLYGKKRKVRFVPKFYPYTEPSIGAQIDCTICSSKGCPACSGAGWVTILGGGIVHENVLKEFGFDPKEVSGFAFGMGTSRLAAQFYNAENLKVLYDNDLRYLKNNNEN